MVSAEGTSAYTYDATSQLTAAAHDYRAHESYSYDANGNRTMSGYDTGDNNQLLSDGTYGWVALASGPPVLVSGGGRREAGSSLDQPRAGEATVGSPAENTGRQAASGTKWHRPADHRGQSDQMGQSDQGVKSDHRGQDKTH